MSSRTDVRQFGVGEVTFTDKKSRLGETQNQKIDVECRKKNAPVRGVLSHRVGYRLAISTASLPSTEELGYGSPKLDGTHR